MSDFINRLKAHPLWIAGGVILIAALAAGGYFGYQVVLAAPPQPIQFNHQLHNAIGVQCAYCHVNASRGDSAGIPSISKCMGCHQQFEPRNAEMEKIYRYAESEEQIKWVPVAIQPDFVRFSHQPHVDFGLECSECHGDLTAMTVAEPQPGQNMGWCLSCHQERAPERFEELSDCATCHY